MPRDPESLTIQKFAENGLIETLAQSGLTWEQGWTAIYEAALADGGEAPHMRTFNFLFRVLSGMARELNQHGVLEHSMLMDYVHPAFVVGTDNELYRSRVSNGPNTGNATDPVTDTANAVWQRYVPAGAGAASESAAGVVEFADATEARNLSNPPNNRGLSVLRGLQLVQAWWANLGFATQANARSGADTTKPMNALRTKDAIDYQVPRLGTLVQIHTTQSSYNAASGSDNKLHIRVP